MFDSTSSKQVFLNTEVGIKNLYQLLYNKDVTGVTKSSLSNPTNLSMNNIPFLEILTQKFDKLDTDSNEILSQEELEKFTSSISKDGLTLEQLSAISTQLSDSEREKIEKIIDNFKKVDKNGDGKLTADEIQNYSIEKEIEDKKESYKLTSTSDFTTFYVDEVSTTTDNDDDDD